MKTKALFVIATACLLTAGSVSAQNTKSTSTTTTTTTEQQNSNTGIVKPVGDQATMDTKSGKKARKAEKKLAKGKEHKALKKQVKADEKEATGR